MALRMEELFNANFESMTESDILIWRYIQSHKRQCCDISIEDLSAQCCVSRATVSRFTQKLSFDGFREFKIRLKLEFENEKLRKSALLDEVCANYVKSIHAAKDTDLTELCDQIFHAERLFVFGTGETQNAAAQMLKRMFSFSHRHFVALAGRSELMMTIEDLGPKDFMIIISFSGENVLAIEAAKQLRGRGVSLLTITRLSGNTLTKLSNKSLYIIPDTLMQIGPAALVSCGAYFGVIEILWIKYMQYLEQREENLAEQ